MFRKLIVLCVLALSGCATYHDARYAHEPVYRDGSYYSPSSGGAGDYYYAPESSGYYDDYYYDSFYSNRYYRGPYWFSGTSPWCSYGHRYGYYYRPCSYGYGRWGGGWGLSLYFGDRWGWGGGWGGGWNYWPYDRYHRWHDRDRYRDRDDGPRRPRDPSNGDRNRNYPDEGLRTPQRVDSDREPGVRIRPIPGNRNERPRNDRPPMSRPPSPPSDRNSNGGDRNGWSGSLPVRSRDDAYMGRRTPDPREGSRNGGPSPERPPMRYEPRPGQVERPLVRNEPRPQPVERPQREPVERSDRNERSRDDDRPEPRSRPRLQ